MLEFIGNLNLEGAPTTSGNTQQGSQGGQGSQGQSGFSMHSGVTATQTGGQEQKTTTTQGEGNSSEDPFAFLLENNQQAGNKEGAAAKAPQKSVFDLSAAEIGESLKDVDYSNLVTPDLAKSMLGANAQPAQVQALSQFANAIAKTVLGQSMAANLNLAKQGVTQSIENSSNGVISNIIARTAQAEVLSELPALGKPTHIGLLQSVQSQILAKKPDISSADLKTLTMDYFRRLGIEPANKQTKESTTSQQTKKGIFSFFQP